jgi:hypothetical protein
MRHSTLDHESGSPRVIRARCLVACDSCTEPLEHMALPQKIRRMTHAIASLGTSNVIKCVTVISKCIASFRPRRQQER